uniref:MARVEL domain-containing protein n=1 Tax=Ascaris lumbricoides TaxID=6252 RepID=A0A0M3IPG9_ASCLU
MAAYLCVSALLGGILSTCIAIILTTIITADGYYMAIAPLIISIICAVLFFVGWSISNILLMIPILVYNIGLEISLIAGAVWSIYSVVDPPMTTLFCDDDDDCGLNSKYFVSEVFHVLSIAQNLFQTLVGGTLRTVTYSTTTTCDAIPVVPPSYTTSTGVTQPHFFVYPLANGSISTNSPMYMNAPITLNDSSSSTHQRSPSEQRIATAPPLNENEKHREDIAPPPYQP